MSILPARKMRGSRIDGMLCGDVTIIGMLIELELVQALLKKAPYRKSSNEATHIT
jgi:hypothetical protein